MSYADGIQHSRRGALPEGGLPSSPNEGEVRIMAKKKNSRKALAVALGIMGIAGLSVASASQLTVTPTNEVAMGVSTSFTSCDDTVGVSYGYDSTYKINSVTITGIADICLGKPLSVSIANITTPGSPIAGTAATMASWTTTSTDANTYKVTITPATVPLTADLGAATVIIG